MYKVIALILFAELWNAAGQIFYKRGMNTLEPQSLGGVSAFLRFIKIVFRSPLIWLGILSMTACLIVWLIALAQADLSFVYPVGSVQYLFVLIAAHLFLGEKIDAMKLVGTLMVVAGVILISVT
jgi:drug/metabolite transporter (DMT)-like permease